MKTTSRWHMSRRTIATKPLLKNARRQDGKQLTPQSKLNAEASSHLAQVNESGWTWSNEREGPVKSATGNRGKSKSLDLAEERGNYLNRVMKAESTRHTVELAMETSH